MKIILGLFFSLAANLLYAQSGMYRLLSPDRKLAIEIGTGEEVRWSVTHLSTPVLLPSEIGMELGNGEVLGHYAVVRKSQKISVNRTFATLFYKKSSVSDQYNELTLSFAGNYGLIFRAYNDGVAYRFFTRRKAGFTVRREIASFHLPANLSGLFPVIPEYRIPGDPFMSGFEALYTKTTVNDLTQDTLSFLPVLLNLEAGKKMAILEADLEDYPGMFLRPDKTSPNSLQAVFAGFPEKESLYRNNLNARVDARAPFIAKVSGTRRFPWRVLLLSTSDKELLDNDMMQKLASPSRVPDISWIRPGKVAWDWWNDWNISRVDFKAGCNTETYRYYIDFAAENKLEYIIMDESWSNDSNLLEVSPAINLDSIIRYGQQRDVGVILWSTMYALEKNTDSLFAHYSRMGVKGFKIDFLDRDDQLMVQRVYAVAAQAAKYKLVLDYHGMYKPSGLQRTFPNVLNCEGVRGLENYKWSSVASVPEYDVQIPFIRMLAGPMDYTPGAMRNASRQSFRAVHSMPMSLGTRCHQLAMYAVYEAPLQMLSDNPTAYRQDTVCTRFIAAFPTVFDETVAIDGSVGEFAVIARRNGHDWYLGALNNWVPRDLSIPLGFLGDGAFEAEIFQDGVNAEKDGTDYARHTETVDHTGTLSLHLAAGGGWAAIIRHR